MIKKKIITSLLCLSLVNILSADSIQKNMNDNFEIKSILNKSDSIEDFMEKLKIELPTGYTILKDYQELSKKKKNIKDMKEFSTTEQFGILLATVYSMPIIYNSCKKYLAKNNLDFMYLTQENFQKIGLTEDYKTIYKKELDKFCSDRLNKDRVICEEKYKNKGKIF